MTMKQGRNIIELATELERQKEAKVDLVASTKDMHVTARTYANSNESHVGIDVGDRQFGINNTGHAQIGGHTGIPSAYYKKMQAEAPDLLATNINRWFEKYPAPRMARTLDGKLRAFLSPAYRPLENADLAEAVLPVLMDLKMMIMSCEVTETRLYIKAVDERILLDIPTGRALGDGSHVFFDTVSPAAIISNSEVGLGSLSVETGTWTKMCTNLAVFSSSGMKRRHIGARTVLDDGEQVRHLLTDETKRATDKAVWMQVRDVVAGAFNEEKFKANVDSMKGAVEQKIEGDPVKVVDLSAKRLGLTEAEGKSVLRHLIAGGDLTRYGLFNAVTRSAQDHESYDRATEIERMGGQVIELPKHDWEVIQKQAA
jgi:hypothetical protein